MKRVWSALLLFISMSSAAQTPTTQTFQRVLVPLFVSNGARSGAFGTMWRTDFVTRNESDTAAAIFQFACVFTCDCVAQCGDIRTPAHSVMSQFLEPGSLGIFLYVDRAVADRVHFNLQVRDAARYERGMGTEVPVVRDSEFLTGTGELLNVPVSPASRLLLRLYGISSNTGSGDVVVRVFPVAGNDLIAEKQATIPPPPDWNRIPRNADLVPYPGILELPLAAIIGSGTEPVRIEVRPLDDTLVYWAFVSVTDNITQHVTTITPQ